MGYFDKLLEKVDEEDVRKFAKATKIVSQKVKDYSEQKLIEGYEFTKEKVEHSIDEYKKSKEAVSESNWYSKKLQHLVKI